MLYVAGPYTKPDPIENVHKTLRVASDLLDTGYVIPVVPHLTLVWHLVTPRPYEQWLEYDLALLARCDALLRIPGESSGADGEEAWARDHDMPVFYFIPHAVEWARHQAALHDGSVT